MRLSCTSIRLGPHLDPDRGPNAHPDSHLLRLAGEAILKLDPTSVLARLEIAHGMVHDASILQDRAAKRTKNGTSAAAATLAFKADTLLHEPRPSSEA